MIYRVIFSPEARDDLDQLYDFISEAASRNFAIGYVGRIEQWCLRLKTFPSRGAERSDLFPGLRVAGFEQRVTIAFRISGDRVVVERILYGGRDLDAVFAGKA